MKNQPQELVQIKNRLGVIETRVGGIEKRVDSIETRMLTKDDAKNFIPPPISVRVD